LATPTRHAPVDLARLVPEAVSLRVPEALAAEIDLGYQGAQGPLPVMGDAASLHELLDNLVDNALRYAGRGSNVTVSLAPLPGGGARLRVEDDGPGVPEEWLARLGERFFRVPGSAEAGTGLGLAIVQRIAERHGARVHYRRAARHGLSVDVHFPPAAVS
jgi:two-component system sensor histidine kinase TctE